MSQQHSVKVLFVCMVTIRSFATQPVSFFITPTIYEA